MPLVRPVRADATRSLIEAPSAVCYLCAAPWQAYDALVLVQVHVHRQVADGAGRAIPETDVTTEFAHEGCAQVQGMQPGEFAADTMVYSPTWDACCAPALAAQRRASARAEGDA